MGVSVMPSRAPGGRREGDSPSISSATRFATDMAATRRGCVQATILPLR